MTRHLVLVALALGSILVLGGSASAAAPNTNGAAGDMPAYYDGKIFTINFKELSPDAERAAIAHNTAINKIYMSDPGLPGGQMFVSVLDAIQGDGFNPLWREFQITFNNGFTPRQLTSDTDVDAAAQSGEITVQPTSEVYRCSVVGTRK